MVHTINVVLMISMAIVLFMKTLESACCQHGSMTSVSSVDCSGYEVFYHK